MTRPPTEPRAGQDDPPSMRAAVVAMLSLLRDLRTFLTTLDHPAAPELLLRVEAHRSALTRLRRHLEGNGGRP